MKPIHLCLSVIFLALGVSPSEADTFSSWNWWQPQWQKPRLTYFRPVQRVEAIFRAQSPNGVPLPSDAGRIPGTNAIPNSGATIPPTTAPITLPSNGYPSTPVPALPVPSGSVNNGMYGAPVTNQPLSWNAFSPQMGSDPFVTQPGGIPATPYAPYSPYGPAPYGMSPYAGGGSFSTFGANGPAPFRMGIHSDLSLEWLPSASVSGASGNLEQFGVDYNIGCTAPCLPGWIKTSTGQFRLRNWGGPTSGPGLPGKAFRFGWDLAIETPHSGPVNWVLGITSSINSDLHDSIKSNAYQLDGRGMMILQLDRYWSVVFGAEFWDRVNDVVIPHVGVVYRDDFWEWRIMFPETEIRLFLGNERFWSKWLYARLEYHVEAYDVRTSGGGRDEVELEDYRALIGFDMKAGMSSWFVEGGWVFDRNVDYGLPGNGSFSPGTGFIGRIGWQY